MKKLVAEHGAVVGTVAAAGEFSNYGGGIFAGCTSSALESDQKVVKLQTFDWRGFQDQGFIQ